MRRVLPFRAAFVLAALFLAAALILAACGDSEPEEPVASPEQEQAIASLIDAELTETEQQCILRGLLETGIDAADIIAGTVTPQEDAELITLSTSCIEDFTAIPGFVQSFIEGAAEGGTVLTEEQAICMIDRLDEADQQVVAFECAGDAFDVSGPTDQSDADLSLYRDGCAGGNPQLCDELYRLAPEGSDDFEFARTCGGLLPDSVGYRCFEELG